MKTYTVDRELALLLKAAEMSGEPLRLVANGSTFVVRVQRERPEDVSDESATYDPEKVREALRRYAGSWSDLDVDELKATMYRARDEGSRQAPAS